MNSSHSPQAHSVNRDIWSLAWPITLASLTVPLVGMVDTAVLGHLPSPHYLGAVAIGAIVFDVLLWAFGFLRAGTTAHLVQPLARDEYKLVKTSFYQSLVLAWVIALVIVFSAPLILLATEAFMQASPRVYYEAEQYIQIRLFATPATLTNFVLAGFFIACRKSRWILVQTVVINLLNALLDLVFVLYFDMRATGVAWGTLIAQYAGLAIGLYLAAGYLRSLPDKASWTRLKQIKDYSKLVGINSALFLRTLCLLFCFLFFYSQSAQMSDDMLAANAMLFMLAISVAYGLDGFANACEALVGRAVGLNEPLLMKRTCRAAAWWCWWVACLYGLVLFVAQTPLIHGLTNLEQVRSLALNYYSWILLLPLINCWAFLLDGIFIGANKTMPMLYSMLASVSFYLCTWFICRPLENHGLWLALSAFGLARGLTLGAYYFHYTRRQLWFSTQS